MKKRIKSVHEEKKTFGCTNWDCCFAQKNMVYHIDSNHKERSHFNATLVVQSLNEMANKHIETFNDCMTVRMQTTQALVI